MCFNKLTLCSYNWTFGDFGDLTPLIFNIDDEIYKKNKINFNNLKHLEDIELIRFDTLTEFVFKKPSNKFSVFYYDTEVIIEHPNPADNKLSLGHVSLSRSGQELASISGAESISRFKDYVIEKWNNKGYKITLIK